MALNLPSAPNARHSKSLQARQRRIQQIISDVLTGTMDGASLACSNIPDVILRDLAGPLPLELITAVKQAGHDPERITRAGDLAQQWRQAMAEGDRRACDRYVLERLGEAGADFPSLVADCYAHYGMTHQELILSLNHLLTTRAIAVHAGLFYTRVKDGSASQD